MIKWHVEYDVMTDRMVAYAMDATRERVFGHVDESGVVRFRADEGDRGPSPLFAVTQEDMRRLMDQMWAAGLRPSNGEGSTGQLGATERHLDDMRTLVWHLAKVPS